jgi:hypothetical protein
MDRFEKVAILNNEIEAQLVDGLLSDRDIPHVMRSYHDSAYDGLFQGAGGWGHIEAPLSFHEKVMRVIEEIRRQARSSGTERADGEESRT